MTDKMRWRYGDTNPVVAAVAAATVIEIGDLLYQDTNNAKPAAMLPTSAARPRIRGVRRRFPGRGHARIRGATPPRCAWRPPACSTSTA